MKTKDYPDNDQELNLDDFEEIPKNEKERLIALTKEAVKNRNKTITLRVSEKLLINIKERAEEFGLPYQSYMQMVLLRHLNGEFYDKSSIDKMVKTLLANKVNPKGRSRL